MSSKARNDPAKTVTLENFLVLVLLSVVKACERTWMLSQPREARRIWYEWENSDRIVESNLFLPSTLHFLGNQGLGSKVKEELEPHLSSLAPSLHQECRVQCNSLNLSHWFYLLQWWRLLWVACGCCHKFRGANGFPSNPNENERVEKLSYRQNLHKQGLKASSLGQNLEYTRLYNSAPIPLSSSCTLRNHSRDVRNRVGNIKLITRKNPQT